MSHLVKTWDERMRDQAPQSGMPDHELIARAMLAEIGDLREALHQRAKVVKNGQWVIVEGRRIKIDKLLEQERNADRYLWLRDKADSMLCTAAPMVASLDDEGRMVGLLDGEELDAAVDAAKTLKPAVMALKRRSAR